ncbi:MAG: hypothetical protein GY852_00960, partial [bacterium]|nr:hypothetical protein [bacterium]
MEDIMVIQDPELFSMGNVERYFQSKDEELDRVAYDRYSDDYLLGVNLSELIEYLVSVHQLIAPKLSTDPPTQDLSNGSYSRVGDCREYTTQILISIPFTGDPDLFGFRPKTHTVSPPRGRIEESKLVLTIESRDQDPEKVQKELSSRLIEINHWLDNLSNDVNLYNEKLREKIEGKLTSRRNKILRDRKLAEALAFPLTSRENAPNTYIVPEIRRKIVPLMQQTGVHPSAPEPVLDMENYEHIIEVIRNMSKVMELSPHAFKTMDEDALRAQFLVQLNAQYKGHATGETF